MGRLTCQEGSNVPESDIQQILVGLAVLGHKIDSVQSSVQEIKDGKMALCQMHTATLADLKTAVKHHNRMVADTSEGGGAKLSLFHGLFQLSNISQSKVVALAKLGERLALWGILAYWIITRALGGSMALEASAVPNAAEPQTLTSTQPTP